MYSDTLFSNTLSRRTKKNAQLFTTDLDCSCLFPMKLKNKAQEALFIFFQQDKVLPKIKCDNTKEMIQGEINKKCKEALCH